MYFLQEKSGAFATFKSFKVIVENEIGCQIQELHADRGGEYISHEFA